MLDIRQVLPTRDGRVKGRLLPNLRSSDPRRGFEKFERPLQLMLVVSLTFYLICYSIHVNRVYMRSQGFSSIGAFIQSDILGLVDSIPTGPGKAVTKSSGKALLSFLFGMQPSEWQRQDYYGDAAQLFVSIFSLIVISETVGRAASRAKEDAEDYYARDTAKSLFGLPIETERDQLRKMTTWPLEWHYYRLGLYVFLLILVTILSWAAKRS